MNISVNFHLQYLHVYFEFTITKQQWHPLKKIFKFIKWICVCACVCVCLQFIKQKTSWYKRYNKY